MRNPSSSVGATVARIKFLSLESKTYGSREGARRGRKDAGDGTRPGLRDASGPATQRRIMGISGAHLPFLLPAM